MAELRVEGLVKRFGRTTVLDDVSLHVPAGSLTAILGPSGSGKTTLLRLVCGFERADAGSVWIDGALVSGPGVYLPPEQRRIGYVPQEGALFPHLSVADNITFGLPRAQRRVHYRVDALLELVGLDASFARRAPQQLSGGQQQRVALARALAPQPALVLLDEPVSALDAALRVETRSAVAAALREVGATALLVTHDQSEALSMGQQVAVLWDGKLAQVDTPQQLYRHPVSPALAQFVGDAVLLPGRAVGALVHCALGALRVAGAGGASDAAGAVQVLIRPEQIRVNVAPAHGPDGEFVQRMDARVLATTFNGHDASVQLQLTDSGLCVSARVPGHRAPDIGAAVQLVVEGAVLTFAPP